MFLDRRGLRVFVYRDAVDMRCGFEKLHSYCIHGMQAIMDQGHVYVFFGKNRRRMKLLVYDGSGLVLIAKRIERGSFMSHAELLGRSEISLQELSLIIHGSVIRRPQVDRSQSSTQREGFALPSGRAQSLNQAWQTPSPNAPEI